MKRKRKKIIFGLIFLIILYFGTSIYINYRHIHVFKRDYNRYLWIFKDTAKTKIDTFLFRGLARNRDALYNYNYDHKYFISIWEFKDLGDIELKNITVNNNKCLDDIKFKKNEIFNKTYSTPLITLKLGFEFNESKLYINIDKTSEVLKTFEMTNNKYFFCKINKMTFNNVEGEPLILFEYKEPKKTLLILYKARKSFFVILVDSKIDFDESIIKIFDLK